MCCCICWFCFYVLYVCVGLYLWVCLCICVFLIWLVFFVFLLVLFFGIFGFATFGFVARAALMKLRGPSGHDLTPTRWQLMEMKALQTAHISNVQWPAFDRTPITDTAGMCLCQCGALVEHNMQTIKKSCAFGLWVWSTCEADANWLPHACSQPVAKSIKWTKTAACPCCAPSHNHKHTTKHGVRFCCRFGTCNPHRHWAVVAFNYMFVCDD